MSINKKSLVGSQPSADPNKSIPKPQAASLSPRLGESKAIRGGSGQSWVNLTKNDVEKYAREHPQSAGKQAGPSFLARLGGVFKRGPKNT